MVGKNKENAGNDNDIFPFTEVHVDNGVGSCDVCHGDHYIVDKSSLQTAPRLYSNCPICVVQNATTTDIGPVTNSK